MSESAMDPRALLEALLELSARAELEVRVNSTSGAGGDFRLTESAACRVGDRIWVVLCPDDPAAHQAQVLAGALNRFRATFLEDTFMAPGIRDFLDKTSSD